MIPIVNNINFYKSPYDFLTKESMDKELSPIGLVVKRESPLDPLQYINKKMVQSALRGKEEGSKTRWMRNI